jgi:enoyl-CoA hydratase/carnithine racemase
VCADEADYAPRAAKDMLEYVTLLGLKPEIGVHIMNHPGSPLHTLTDKLVARKDGSIGWIIFNNPARHNAVSLEMWQSIPMVLETYAGDPEVRVVILKGEGGKAFVSGADISQFKEKRSSPEAVKIYNAASDAASEALRSFPKPTIAMIRGYCIGGGTATAVNCDIRIASDDARFGVPAAKLGLGYRFSGIRRLAGIVGPSFTAEIFFTGRQFTAQEALQMNLVNRVVPAAELEKYTLDYAATIGGNAPLTIAAVKRALIEYLKDPAERDLDLCQKMIDRCFESEDYREGQAAFMEKRKPVFKGR